jgi:hypothetical protein
MAGKLWCRGNSDGRREALGEKCSQEEITGRVMLQERSWLGNIPRKKVPVENAPKRKVLVVKCHSAFYHSTYHYSPFTTSPITALPLTILPMS